MVPMVLLALRIQRRGRQWAEVCAWHSKVWYLETRIVGRHSWRD
jgi:hypothetical protein